MASHRRRRQAQAARGGGVLQRGWGPIKQFHAAWYSALRRASITDLRFHDLRGEFASRLMEKGVPLSQVRDLLGHSSIVTTERYGRQRFEALEGAVKLMDTGESFQNLSSQPEPVPDDRAQEQSEASRKSPSVN